MMHVDAAELEIFKNLFHSTAEEMGAALRRSAFSPNIKERRDYSCAVFDGRGRAVAMGDHMPVHLGSMPMSVAAALHAIELSPGDIAMLNDPYAGGTHLPDITLVMPVWPLDKGASGARAGPERSSALRTPDRPCFCCQSRAPRRRGRRTTRLHGAQSGNLSGRPAHPACGARTRRKNTTGCPCHPPRQRADAA